MRTAYLECFSGISGDMLLGALVDAGVSFELLAKTAEELNVGARLEQERVLRGGLSGTRIHVLVEGESAHTHHGHEHAHAHGEAHSHDHSHSHAQSYTHEHTHAEQAPAHSHRSLSVILKIIADAPLTAAVKARASLAFQLLGEAEAGIHNKPIQEIHFHEVGAVDTIVDIVCSAVGIEALGVERWVCSALNVGSGTVECAHGILPVPAPATLALLGKAPVYAAGAPMERVTPTGAALIRMLDVQYGILPPMSITESGYGAGGKDLPGIPNLLRLLVGEDEFDSGTLREPLVVLEAVLDDANPQLLAWVTDQLLDQGASDVYQTPIYMKKNRCGVLLTVLCHPNRISVLRDLIFRETTTIGMHWRFDQKMALERTFHEVLTPWGPVRIKVASFADGKVANAQPEYEDCRAIAEREGIPLKQVMRAATAQWMARNNAQEE